ELVEMALSRGANANVLNRDGHSVMAAAVRGGNPKTIETLKQHGIGGGDHTAVERFIGACVRLDDAHARALLGEHPRLLDQLDQDDYEILVRAVSIDRRPLLALMHALRGGVRRAGE